MCGIAGFFSQNSISPVVVDAMQAELRRRGPDAQHAVAWDEAFNRVTGTACNALLHARLSIIDPRPEADQPMSSRDGNIWICYNGEVYGYEAEKAALQQSGAVFRTHSDTEFILHAYEAWGIEALLEKLRGMFAFAIVDRRARKVHLARDRMGEKPLVYSLLNGSFAFGSLVRSVLPFLPKNERTFLPEAIDAYLAHRYIPAPATIFSAIERLENGHRLEFDLDSRQLRKARYWHPQPTTRSWLEVLDESVRLRTVADRPLGLFLSGGIDSNVIASRLATQHLTQFSTFTATFPGSSQDESAVAERSAELLGLQNEAVVIPSRLTDEFERIVADMDQPFADPSCIPTWYLARTVSQQVKVVLVGDGGDELLAGYKRVYKHLRSRWRGRLTLPFSVTPALDGKQGGKWRTEMAMDWQSAYSLRFSGFTPAQRMFLQPGRALHSWSYWRQPDWEAEDALSQLLAIDFANYLPEYILQKSDLCTMAHGLEGRAPLLDHQVFQSLMSVPMAKRYTKPPKLLFRGALPSPLADILFQGKKRGFNPPLTDWLRHDLAPRLCGLGQRLELSTEGQLHGGMIDQFAATYMAGAEHLAEQLLQLLILDVCLQQLRQLAGSR